MELKHNLAFIASDAHLVTFLAYARCRQDAKRTIVCLLDYKFDDRLVERARQSGLEFMKLEDVLEWQFDNIFLFPNFFLFASDFSKIHGKALSRLDYKNMIWAADSWANKIYNTFYFDSLPKEIVYFGVELVDEILLRQASKEWAHIIRTIVTVDALATLWAEIHQEEGDLQQQLATPNMAFCFLRDWGEQTDFRYKPVNKEEINNGIVEIIQSNPGINTVVLKNITFEPGGELYDDTVAAFTRAGLTVVDWLEFATGNGLARMPEALLFSGSLRNAGAVFCFDSSLNYIFGLGNFFEGDRLELGAESLMRIFERQAAIDLVVEQLKWMKKAAQLSLLEENQLGRDLAQNGFQVKTEGYLFSLSVGQALAADFRSHLHAAQQQLEAKNIQFQQLSNAYEHSVTGTSAQSDALAKENTHVSAERDALAKERKLLIVERDALAKEKKLLNVERDALVRDIESITASWSWRLSLPIRVLAKPFLPKGPKV